MYSLRQLQKGLLGLIFTIALPLAALPQDEFYETLPNGSRPVAITGTAQGEAQPATVSRQYPGSLSGRIIFTSAGHGWAWTGRGWATGRGVGHEMNEDYGNLDQMNFFIPYAFNSGATVVAFRPIGNQPNEVVLDNDSRGVRFSGKWFKSSSPIYYGKPGATPYRFALLGQRETATATYTPRLPVAGFYPVYTWARNGPDRTSQLYRILHTGGESQVRVPHHRVGSGWVYLGTYYFSAGADRKQGSVVISNWQPSPGFGAVVVADAIRFGNGMGDFVPADGAGVSTYPREEEASWYWVRRSLGQGQTNVLAERPRDQSTSNVSAPPRMAREMNRESAGKLFDRVFLGFHSNAGGSRGAIGLWNNAQLFPGTDTPHQKRLAELLGGEVTTTFCELGSPPLEVPWFKRTALAFARGDYAFGEINNRAIENEFDATIVEVAFHDSVDDARLLRDPRVRDLVGRSSYRALVRYFHEFDLLPLQFLPEPPRNLRVTASTSGALLAWDEPTGTTNSPAEGYLVWRSENGYGFGRPVRVDAAQRSCTVADLPRGRAAYFRVTAVNAAGESLPSAVAGCRVPRREGERRVLFVNGFDEFTRFNNPRQTLHPTNYVMPSAVGKMDRVIPRLNNAFDYVVQHGDALAANGVVFDSCERAAVGSGAVTLTGYDVVIWAAGRQRTNLLSAAEQQSLARYLAKGGKLLLSGSHLDNLLRQCANDSGDLGRQLHVQPADEPGSAVRFLSCEAEPGSFFRRRAQGIIGDASDNSYFVESDCRLAPSGPGAQASLRYPGSTAPAAVQYDGSAGGGKVVCLGFPFECISPKKLRAQLLADALAFFSK